VKCIRCGHDSNYKDRSDGKCPTCRGAFAFEPRTGAPFTDQAFRNAIDRVSSDGSVAFTRRNLFYEVDRLRKRSSSWFTTVALLIAAGIGFTAGIGGAGGLPITIAVVASVIAIFKIPFPSNKHVKLEWDAFVAHLASWERAHGTPMGLFKPKTGKELPAGPESKALRAELAQYSFDRAVITDTNETADVLLANNFHFENNCAVLSVNGHPAHAFATVRGMLRNNPRIEVYVLHDCTPEGCTLATTLREDAAWFKGVGQVFDVALRPAQARKMKASWQPGAAAVEKHPALSEDDRRFLADHAVELAAIRPEQLVKALFRAMTILPAAAGSSGDTGASSDVVLWDTGATSSDGGGDSFG
jgi:hypothetical protein